MSVLCIACQREVFGHGHASFCDVCDRWQHQRDIPGSKLVCALEMGNGPCPIHFYYQNLMGH